MIYYDDMPDVTELSYTPASVNLNSPTNVTYTAINISGSSYIWDIPSGYTPNGTQTTNSITLLHNGFETQPVKVRVNRFNCSLGQEIAKAIPLNLPPTSGPDVACPGATVTFAINNLPAYNSIQWTPSESLTLVESSGNTATFRADDNYVGRAFIGATVVIGNQTVVLQRKALGRNISVLGITGPSTILFLQRGDYDASANCMCPIVQYDWYLRKEGDYNAALVGSGLVGRISLLSVRTMSASQVAPANQTSTSSVTDESILRQPPVTTYYYLSLVAWDINGDFTLTNELKITAYGNAELIPFYIDLDLENSSGENVKNSFASPVIAYPNPTNNILNIELNREAITTGHTYDIRLYDGQGNMFRRTTSKGAKVEFNMANLKSGILLPAYL